MKIQLVSSQSSVGSRVGSGAGSNKAQRFQGGKGRVGRGNRGGGRVQQKKAPPTAEELDADLDAYTNKVENKFFL